MKLQKHYTRKGNLYPKYEIVLPKEAIEEAGFKEGDELGAEAKKGEIKLKKKKIL
jgi:bifunctional DNA-binding transcriptional regulator/antitoxin component of YhaV-PrlF toxin-antitoxin module